MSIFDPKPIYRVASRAENLAMALDLPFSPLKNLWEQAQQGAIDSFGLGTIIKDFSIPRSVAPDTTPQPLAPGIDPISLAVRGYEAVRGTFGAQPGGKVLSEQEWKTSPYARDGVPWDAGMTEDRAAALAATWDQRQARAYFGQKDMVTTLAGGFLGNLVDPINYVPIFGPAARLAATAKFGFVAGHALIGASEAAINTAVFGALTTPARASLGDDVSWEAAINNIAFSAVAGAVFGAGGGAWAKFHSTRVAKAEAGLRTQIETIKNLEASRAALNDAVTSLATTGEVKLTPASATTLERMAAEVTDRRTSARALDRETQAVTGTKAGEVVIAPSGNRVAVRPEVVDISTLQRAEGDLQVRDRSGRNAVSNAQIEDIALNLDPARLMPNVDGSQGAPLVGPDNVVDSGNGRVASILRASEAYPQKYEAYKQALVDAGYSIDGIDRPVLISRRVTDLSPEARAQFNAELNSATTARMSAVETAAMDRAAIDDGVLDAFDGGAITDAGNRAFVSRFLANIPQNERGALVGTSGTLSADGARRIENALIAAAYGDVDATVIRRFAEATDDNTRAVVGALSDVAGRWLQMRRAVKAGEIGAEFDQTVELTEALRLLSRWREQAAKEKRPVSIVIKEGMAQGDMISGEIDLPTRAFIMSFYNSTDFGQAAGRETIAGRLNDLVDTTLEAGRPSLFGDAYAATKLGVLKHAFGSDVETALREIERMGASLEEVGGARGRGASGADGQANQGGVGQGGRGARNAAEIGATLFDDLLGAPARDQASLDLAPPKVDMQEPRPDPVPEGLDLAAARVTKSEDVRALAEQFGVDEAGTFVEQADIDQMRTEGRLTVEDEAALAATDQVYADAEAYGETLRVAAACMAR